MSIYWGATILQIAQVSPSRPAHDLGSVERNKNNVFDLSVSRYVTVQVVVHSKVDRQRATTNGLLEYFCWRAALWH